MKVSFYYVVGWGYSEKTSMHCFGSFTYSVLTCGIDGKISTDRDPILFEGKSLMEKGAIQ